MIRRLRLKAAHGLGKVRFGGSATSIFEHDWDVCLVLDGLRYDVARQYFPDAESLRSVASTSQRWVPRTFSDVDGSDLGIVTGNPYYEQLDSDRFAHYHHAELRTVDGIRTIPPIDILNAAVRAWRDREELGIKQLVVHAMQPHAPFRSRPEWFSTETDGFGSSIWQRAAVGDVDDAAVWCAYQDNLAWVDRELVTPLIKNTDAQIAITADHGNARGEAGCWGHPGGVDIPALRQVPWIVRKASDRETVAGAVERTNPDTEAQLEALGYR